MPTMTSTTTCPAWCIGDHSLEFAAEGDPIITHHRSIPENRADCVHLTHHNGDPVDPDDPGSDYGHGGTMWHVQADGETAAGLRQLAAALLDAADLLDR